MSGGLTDRDLRTIAGARQLAALSGAEAVCEHTGYSDPVLAYADALGRAQSLLADLVLACERLAGEAEEGRE